MPLPPGVLADQEYKGIALPVFYTTRMPLRAIGQCSPDRHERPGKNLRQTSQSGRADGHLVGQRAAHPLLVNQRLLAVVKLKEK